MKKKDERKNIQRFWGISGALLCAFVLFFLSIVKGWIGHLPRMEELENPINKYATQVISSDMKIMGTYAQSKENRMYIDYNKLSPSIIHALISTEDTRFFNHSGIDFLALFRVVVKRGILFQKSGGGGSTISQQLAKQLYFNHADNFLERLFQKPIEWVIAVQLERFYTKEEIINLYLNKFDFLYNAVGIQTACHVYFGKSPQDILPEEAATLVGMCKNPTYFNPLKQKERAKGRRNVVLDLMKKSGFISKEDCDSMKRLPLLVNYHKVDHKEGITPYFREYLRLTLTAVKPNRKDYTFTNRCKYVSDSIAWATNPLYGWCNKNKKADGSYYNLYTDGLKIYTTINSRMQTYAEEAIFEHVGKILQPVFFKEKQSSSNAPYSSSLSKEVVFALLEHAMKQTDRYRSLQKDHFSERDIKTIFNTPIDMQVFSWQGTKDTVMSPMDSIRYMKSFLRTGFLAMDSHSGEVKAYVGGIDYKHFQYDMVSTGKRQVGSTIKPYLYSLAMESGFTPCDEVDHEPQVFITETGETWVPRNTNPYKKGEKVTLRWGLQNSDNWVSAYLMKQLSPYTFKQLLLSYGLSEPINAVVSLCLGSCEASVEQMVSGYSAFANAGVRLEPILVTHIEDKFGKTLATFYPKKHDVISEQACYKMLGMMQSVVDGGTGACMRRYVSCSMGGKTGTTQNNSDCWFIGFTPSLVIGCWVGGEERAIHFNTMNEGQGARAALPVVGIFLKKVFSDSNLKYSMNQSFAAPCKFLNSCTFESEEEDNPLSNKETIDEFF